MKKMIVLVIALVLALSLVACGGNPASTSTGNNTTPGVSGTEVPGNNGTYEGEYDASGKRSGYGVWIYHNFRYEGYFKNDMPNGEGTLYETSIPPANKEPDKTYTAKTIVLGNWMDGFASGTITLSWYMDSGDTHTWTFAVENGYPTQDGKVYTADGSSDLNYKKDWLVAGVPPWADVKTDSSIAPPPGEGQPNAATPEPTPVSTPSPEPAPSETPTEAVIPEAGMGSGTVAVAGTYYKGDQCIYMLPDGLSCWGYQESVNGDGFGSLWTQDWFPPVEDKAKSVSIQEYYEKVTDFETRTAEQWVQYIYQGNDMGFEDVKIEKATVDGCPAVKLTYKLTEDGSVAYNENWVIDAPQRTIVVIMANFELCENPENLSKWVEDIVFSIKMTGAAEKPSAPESSSRW